MNGFFLNTRSKSLGRKMIGLPSTLTIDGRFIAIHIPHLLKALPIAIANQAREISSRLVPIPPHQKIHRHMNLK
jgi:hypothetical protein